MLSKVFLPLVLVTSVTLPLFSSRALGAIRSQQVEFENQEPSYTFGEQMVFSGEIQSSQPVREAQLFIQPVGMPDTLVLPLEVDEQGKTSATVDLREAPFRAFSDLNYWYRAVSADGQALNSPKYSIRYADNRFDWKQLVDEQITLHWYAGDLSFAQEVLNIARSSALNWRNYVNIPLPGKTGIYVYDSVEAMQSALQPSAQTWVAAHADPDLGIILVSLPPGPEQHLEMERQIPHELMHSSLFSALGPAYASLPAWLNEGLASMAELYPNPDYQGLLENAYESGELQPLSALCRSFPVETDQALVAYAQAASLTRFIFDQFGPGALEEILAYVLQGNDCQASVEGALGVSLDQLESQWRQTTFSEKAWQEALSSLLPWAVLTFLVITIPVILMLGMIRREPAEIE